MDRPLLIAGKRALAVIGALAVLFVWLFRYELKQDKNGNMVRLNRITGEIVTIVGDQLVVAEKTRKPARPQATEAHAWNSVKIEELGSLQFEVTTMWRDDSMLYRIQVSPFSEQISKALEYPATRAKFSVLFEDQDGFEVATAGCELMDVVRIADGKGGSSGIERAGSVSLPFDAYSRIRSVNVAWSGFPARAATDCVIVRAWDVRDQADKAVLLLRLANSCSQTFALEGTVKLWDGDDKPIGDRRIPIGRIAANESRDFEYGFGPPVAGIKFLALR